MTITELIAEIKWEAELEQDSTWDNHLLLLIWDEMVQIASLQLEASLYISQFEIDPGSQGVDLLVTLPALIKIDRIEYLSAGQIWILPDRNQKIPPVPIVGLPRAHEIVQGVPPQLKLSLIPSVAMGIDDRVFLSYWKIPPVPVGGDTIFPVSWIQPLKTNCIRRAMIFNASTADVKAQMFSQILQKAEAVSQSSNESLDTNQDEAKSS